MVFSSWSAKFCWYSCNLWIPLWTRVLLQQWPTEKTTTIKAGVNITIFCRWRPLQYAQEHCDSKTGNKHAVETNMLQHRDLVVPHALARFNLRFAMLCERTGEKCRQQHGNEKETTWQRSKIVLEPLQYNWYPTEVLLKLIQTISCPSLWLGWQNSNKEIVDMVAPCCAHAQS